MARCGHDGPLLDPGSCIWTKTGRPKSKFEGASLDTGINLKPAYIVSGNIWAQDTTLALLGYRVASNAV
jgi:hypothetical protein